MKEEEAEKIEEEAKMRKQEEGAGHSCRTPLGPAVVQAQRADRAGRGAAAAASSSSRPGRRKREKRRRRTRRSRRRRCLLSCSSTSLRFFLHCVGLVPLVSGSLLVGVLESPDEYMIWILLGDDFWVCFRIHFPSFVGGYTLIRQREPRRGELRDSPNDDHRVWNYRL